MDDSVQPRGFSFCRQEIFHYISSYPLIRPTRTLYAHTPRNGGAGRLGPMERMIVKAARLRPAQPSPAQDSLLSGKRGYTMVRAQPRTLFCHSQALFSTIWAFHQAPKKLKHDMGVKKAKPLQRDSQTNTSNSCSTLFNLLH